MDEGSDVIGLGTPLVSEAVGFRRTSERACGEQGLGHSSASALVANALPPFTRESVKHQERTPATLR